MADIPHAWPGYIQIEEQQFSAAVSEYTGQRLGAAQNYLYDQNASNAARISSLEVQNVVKGSVGALGYSGSISSVSITKIAGTHIRVSVECNGAKTILDPNSAVVIFMQRGVTVIASVVSDNGASSTSQSAGNNPTMVYLDVGLAAGTYTYSVLGSTSRGLAATSGTVRIVAEEIR